MPMAVEAQHLGIFKAATGTTRDLVDSADDYVVLDPSSASCASRKRPRDYAIDTDINRQIMAEDDCILAQHIERMRAEMMEGKVRFARQLVSLVDERVSERLRAKDEEIERTKRLNSMLEEKIRALATESQVWQYLAQTNEAAANALRANLQHVLQAQQQQQRADGDHDAESCCGDNLEEGRRRLCRSCSACEPSVLLLPCRHLCLCPTCARAADVCPVCRCCRTGSVNVNLS